MNHLKYYLFILTFIISSTSFAQEFRDWDKFPAIEQIDTEENIYVIADIHGDCKRFADLLAVNGLISGKRGTEKWEGGKSVLVIVGDLISKWSGGLDAITLLQSIKQQAETAGGKVIIVTGNHEVEFMEEANDTPCGTDCGVLCEIRFKKTKKFKKELIKIGINPLDVAKACDEKGIGLFMKNMAFAARVNDWFFVHAGLSEEITLSALENRIVAEVNKHGLDADILLTKKAKHGILGERMKKSGKSWWNTDKKADGNEQELRKRVDGLSEGTTTIRHLVFGHQPKKYKIAWETANITRPAFTIFQAFDGLVFLVDVGMSRGVNPKNNTSAILKIKAAGKDVATVLNAKGVEKTLWVEE